VRYIKTKPTETFPLQPNHRLHWVNSSKLGKLGCYGCMDQYKWCRKQKG